MNDECGEVCQPRPASSLLPQLVKVDASVPVGREDRHDQFEALARRADSQLWKDADRQAFIALAYDVIYATLIEIGEKPLRLSRQAGRREKAIRRNLGQRRQAAVVAQDADVWILAD